MLAVLEQHAGPPSGDATRHLRAAAQMDRKFRTSAIEELVEHQYRVPAPAPGVDSALVLIECLRARRAAVLAATAITVITVLGLVAAPATTLAVLWMLIVIRLVAILVRAARTRMARRGFSMDQASPRVIVSIMLATLAMLAMGIPLLAVVGYLLTSSLLATSDPDRGTTIGGYPGTTPGGGVPPSWLSLLLIVAWIAVGTAYRYQRRRRMASLVTPKAQESTAGDQFTSLHGVFQRLSSRLSEAETVHGDYSPFVGSGVELFDEKWSFAIELRPNAERLAAGDPTDPLATPDLNRELAAGLTRLGAGVLYPGDLLHRISVRDRVFRFGLHAQHPGSWFGAFCHTDPNTGVRVLNTDWANWLDLGSHERLRHYLEARVELWEQQVVVSVFLRVHVQGDLLQMEGMPFVLTPVAAEYREIDSVPPIDPATDLPTAMWNSITALPRDVTSALVEPVSWIRSMIVTMRLQQWYRRMLAGGHPVQHGPRFSLRELAADPEYQQRFQEVDADRFVASVRKRVATTVLETLRSHGYDTAEFEQFVQSININHGIQNINSTVTGTQAAGSFSRAR